jgi:flagellar biosynthesis component FlhA
LPLPGFELQIVQAVAWSLCKKRKKKKKEKAKKEKAKKEKRKSEKRKSKKRKKEYKKTTTYNNVGFSLFSLSLAFIGSI